MLVARIIVAQGFDKVRLMCCHCSAVMVTVRCTQAALISYERALSLSDGSEREILHAEIAMVKEEPEFMSALRSTLKYALARMDGVVTTVRNVVDNERPSRQPRAQDPQPLSSMPCTVSVVSLPQEAHPTNGSYAATQRLIAVSTSATLAIGINLARRMSPGEALRAFNVVRFLLMPLQES